MLKAHAVNSNCPQVLFISPNNKIRYQFWDNKETIEQIYNCVWEFTGKRRATGGMEKWEVFKIVIRFKTFNILDKLSCE